MITDLRAAIARDLAAVKPLWRPSVRALTLAPLAVAIVVAVPMLTFFRSDLTAIGFLRAWGFSIGQACAGLVIVSAGLREAIPGRTLSRAALAWTIAAGLAMPAALLVLTASTVDVRPAPGQAVVVGAGCFR